MSESTPFHDDDRLPPAHHWPRWEALSGYFFDGPILGNGLIGAVVHRQSPDRFDGNANTILFAFNRADLTQPVPRIPEGPTSARFMVGRFTLRPAGTIDAIEMELNLAVAELRGTVLTSRGRIELRAIVHATRPILMIEQTAYGDEVPAAINFLPAPAGVVRVLGRVDYEESATYDPHPPARRTQEDDIALHEQSIGGGRSYTVAWTQHSTAPQQGRFHATLAYSHPVEAAGAFDPVSAIRDARERDPATLVEEHRDWWSQHYSRLALKLPDDPQTERFWWLQQYKIGCLMRPHLQLLDLLGPWYCHTPWPGIWWNLNTQMMYRHLATGNRTELAAPLLRILERNVEQLRRNLPEDWQDTGALAIGRASSFDLDSPVTMIANEADPTLEGREAGNLLWALHTVWWLLEHAGDHDAIRTRLIPLLRRGVKLYAQLLLEGDDGKWHLRETFSPEYKAAADCHYDLSLLRWACGLLADRCPDDPDAAEWRDVVGRLVDYPLDAAGTFAVGRGVVFDRGHRHFSHLLGIWPVGDIDCGPPESAARVLRSIEHWLSRGELAGWSHAVAAAMYARLGRGEAAIEQFRDFLRSLTFTTLYREAGLCLETPFLGLDALYAMLVQSGPGEIRLLPALPKAWRSLQLDGLRLFGAATLALTLRDDRIYATVRSTTGLVARVSFPGTLQATRGSAEQQADGSWMIDIPAHGGEVEFTGKVR
ncbi:MAG TPA: hypothetical protein VGN72_20265 [Tepidisphaeraceae bacterium]|jgi:hypothetical protein|nr:hypothetical protein [Tepidisphaeraceae bacterium]